MREALPGKRTLVKYGAVVAALELLSAPLNVLVWGWIAHHLGVLP